MKKALTVTICLISIFSLFGQTNNQNPQNSPGEINDPSSYDKTSSAESGESVQELTAVIKSQEKTIESLYFIEEQAAQSGTSYGSGAETIVKQVKRKIYKAGKQLIKNEQELLSKASEDAVMKRHLNEIININDRLLEYGRRKDTKAKEKELKKLKEIDAIKTAFFKD